MSYYILCIEKRIITSRYIISFLLLSYITACDCYLMMMKWNSVYCVLNNLINQPSSLIHPYSTSPFLYPYCTFHSTILSRLRTFFCNALFIFLYLYLYFFFSMASERVLSDRSYLSGHIKGPVVTRSNHENSATKSASAHVYARYIRNKHQ